MEKETLEKLKEETRDSGGSVRERLEFWIMISILLTLILATIYVLLTGTTQLW